MKERLLLPPKKEDVPLEHPLIFLAGPVQGAPNWQDPVAKEILDYDDVLFVASPRKNYMPGEFNWDKQVSWEKRELTRAAVNGVILFWFAAQDHSLPYEEGRPYAQTSRIELGRVAGWRDFSLSTRFVIGIDPMYTPNGGGNERYFRHTAAEFRIHVHNNVDSLTDEALSIT